VRITLAHEVSGKNQADVARELGKAVQQALSAAKGSKAVSARSGSYGVWPMNDEQGRISNWRGRAEIILESDNFAAASDLAGQLGDTMAVAQVGFYLSPEARAACEAELLDDASRAFRERASALAKSFGFSDYSIRELSLNDTGARYDAAPRTMAMAADKSVAVPLEPGKEQVSVSISGSIFLRSAKE
jgi:predicted secreted protein